MITKIVHFQLQKTKKKTIIKNVDDSLLSYNGQTENPKNKTKIMQRKKNLKIAVETHNSTLPILH